AGSLPHGAPGGAGFQPAISRQAGSLPHDSQPGGSAGTAGTQPAAGGGSTDAGTADQSSQTPDSTAALTQDYGRMPLGFEANVGQTDPTAQFIGRANQYTVFLTATGPVLTLQRPLSQTLGKDAVPVGLVEDVLGLQLIGSDPTVRGTGQQPIP